MTKQQFKNWNVGQITLSLEDDQIICMGFRILQIVLYQEGYSMFELNFTEVMFMCIDNTFDSKSLVFHSICSDLSLNGILTTAFD